MSPEFRLAERPLFYNMYILKASYNVTVSMLRLAFTFLTSLVFTGFDSFLKNDAVFHAESQINTFWTDCLIHITLKLFYHLIREGDTSNFLYSKQTC